MSTFPGFRTRLRIRNDRFKGDRDLRPFATTSIWRLGISTSATFASTSDPKVLSIRNNNTSDKTIWVNNSNYSHPVNLASDTDPMATVNDPSHGVTRTYNVPETALIARGSDKHMHVINPARTWVDENFYVTKQSSTQYTASRAIRVDLSGSGIGPQNGTRAYGGSAIGGLIRKWEINPSHPAYTGRIEHALAISLRNDQLFMDSANWTDGWGYYTGGTLPNTRPGWPAGTPAAGFMKMPGYVWPATEQDYDSPGSYAGVIPMGSYFAIPSSVDLTTVGFTPQGLMVAKAAQDYGCYVTDRSGSATLYVEDTGPDATVDAFINPLLGPSYTAQDLHRIFSRLVLVTNNGPDTPNGGPLGSTRRGA